jgi:tetratricopeptide (TPR) repeat protein
MRDPIMTKSFSILGITMGLVLCGCSSHSVQGLSNSQAQGLNSQNATISDAKDPEIKANTHFAAGQLAEVKGETGTAISQYNDALSIDPNHLPSMYALGVIYAELKQYNTSLDVWHRYAKASNNAPESYGNIGYCYELLGNPKEAVAVYEQGIAKYPNNASCRTNYGLMLARENKIQEAVRMWTPVMTDAQIHYNLATIYRLDGRKTEARAEYQKALDEDPASDAKSRLAEMQ